MAAASFFFCRLLSFARPLLTFAAYASGDDGASMRSFYNDGYAAEGLPWRETVKLTCESYGGRLFVGCPFLFWTSNFFFLDVQIFFGRPNIFWTSNKFFEVSVFEPLPEKKVEFFGPFFSGRPNVLDVSVFEPQPDKKG